ncbi:branched-chain amino acid transporter AzlC [Bifidobacterium sp. SMB2]|uniref:Branched-chain amino acid transporter AzlC n=1 Tax=Bifidobacterium saimiriisciurei TaxID=2661627 RepID=A0ABX0CGJ0_9BIFI|nr:MULTISPECIES: AzlC family ABC transporter permease [Bifidobacterium]NEG95384.1 branched-chain amino acid transporter AzlC [Bifidobacterium sp. SMB2]NEH11432.1 branched-chain amino acid transporter AzlC [Bifidobacterium saimiriisciurei]
MALLRTAFRAALPPTLPIAAGFLFFGGSYGLLMHAKGFPIVYPLAMGYVIFAGSMEFVTVNLLLSPFAPWAAFLLAIMVNARHLFYGLSMLDTFRGLGWKKPYLIFTMIDETFAIDSSVHIPTSVDRGWFMVFVSALCRSYWFGGIALGWLAGGVLPFDTKGIEFVLAALFLSILLGQWDDDRSRKEDDGSRPRSAIADLADSVRPHVPALVGLLMPAICLALFGPDRFMIPAMALMLVAFLVLRARLEDPDGGRNTRNEEER